MDYALRRAALKAAMARQGLDGLLIGQNANKRYLFGYEDFSESTGVDSYVFITSGRDYMFVEFGDKLTAERLAPECTVWATADREPLGHALRRVADEQKIKRLGYEHDSLKLAAYTSMQEAAPELEYVPACGLVEELRAVKDAEEIELIAAAQHITEKVFEYIIPYLKVGVSEKQIAVMMDNYARSEFGVEGPSFPTIVSWGDNSADNHARCSERRLKDGDFLMFDFGYIKDGYCGDMTRTLVMGQATPEQLRIYDIVLEAQTAACAAAKAGMRACDLDKVARDIISSYGYGIKEYGHILGHSIGLKCHEEPMLFYDVETVLQAGNVVSIEPGIYIEGWGGVRIEDLVVLEKNGCRNLNSFEKQRLIVLK